MRSAIAIVGLVVLSAALTFSFSLGALRERVEQLEHQTYVCTTQPDTTRVCTQEKP